MEPGGPEPPQWERGLAHGRVPSPALAAWRVQVARAVARVKPMCPCVLEMFSLLLCFILKSFSCHVLEFSNLPFCFSSEALCLAHGSVPPWMFSLGYFCFPSPMHIWNSLREHMAYSHNSCLHVLACLSDHLHGPGSRSRPWVTLARTSASLAWVSGVVALAVAAAAQLLSTEAMLECAPRMQLCHLREAQAFSADMGGGS